VGALYLITPKIPVSVAGVFEQDGDSFIKSKITGLTHLSNK